MGAGSGTELLLAELLLAGPRGRRFCLEVAEALRPEVRPLLPMFASRPTSREVRDALAMELARVNPDDLVALTDEPRLFAPLVAAVDTARYWQPPDEEDNILRTSEIIEALRPVAEAITASPSTAWWASPAAVKQQRYVMWMDGSPSDPLATTGAAAKLATWRAVTLADEADARSRPADPEAMISGVWWSTPALVRLPTTTRSLPNLEAVQLALVEDRFSWAKARVSHVDVKPHPRMYEITGPNDWASLAKRYPLDVSRSRLHDWWRATGETGQWIIPDWAAGRKTTRSELFDRRGVVRWVRPAPESQPIHENGLRAHTAVGDSLRQCLHPPILRLLIVYGTATCVALVPVMPGGIRIVKVLAPLRRASRAEILEADPRVFVTRSYVRTTAADLETVASNQ